MKQLIVLPTWLITHLFILPFLPKTHEWYGKKFGLKDWAEHGTWFSYYVSSIIWIGAIMLFTAYYLLFTDN